MKLRTLSRIEIYDIEEQCFWREDWLCKPRDEKQLTRLIERFSKGFAPEPSIVLHLSWNEEWDGFDLEADEDPRLESSSWCEDGVWNIYLAPSEETNHWLIHELAHILQGDEEEEEHSPAWLLHYIDILRTFRRNRAANNLLKALT